MWKVGRQQRVTEPVFVRVLWELKIQHRCRQSGVLANNKEEVVRGGGGALIAWGRR